MTAPLDSPVPPIPASPAVAPPPIPPAPKPELEPTPDQLAEAERRRYLSHESAIRSVGMLYQVCGGLILASAVISLLIAAAAMFGLGNRYGAGAFGFIVYAFAAGLVGYLSWWIGDCLRRLDNEANSAATLLAVLNLLNVPFGSLFGGYVLYLLHSAAGRHVMTWEYGYTVDVTPHIEARITWWAWLLLVLLVGSLLVGGWVVVEIVQWFLGLAFG
ncbi:MAG: hypothetical protein AAGC60_11345 [Acidobacteriota bacterium]